MIIKNIQFIFFLFLLNSHVLSQQNTIIEVQLEGLKSTDVINIAFFEALNIKKSIDRAFSVKESYCKYQLPSFKNIAYYYIELPGKAPLKFYPIEEGDSVLISVHPDTIIFSGRGSSKAQFMYLNSRYFEAIGMKNGDIPFDLYMDILDARINNGLRNLKNWENNLTPLGYSILKAEIYGYANGKKIQNLLLLASKLSSEAKKLYKNKVASTFSNLISNDTFALNWHYLLFSYEKIMMDQIFNDRPRDWKSIYLLINKNFTGVLKQRLIVHHLQSMLKKGLNENVKFCVNDFLTKNRVQEYSVLIKSEYEFAKLNLVKGAIAKDFKLVSSNGQETSLNDFKGKVILIHFWFTGCTGCKEITPMMNKLEKYFQGNPKIEFISIAIDKDKEIWLRSVATGIYTNKGIINLYTGGEGEAHKVIKDYAVTAYPRLVIIDGDGKIFDANAPRPDNDDGKVLLQTLNSALNKMPLQTIEEKM